MSISHWLKERRKTNHKAKWCKTIKSLSKEGGFFVSDHIIITGIDIGHQRETPEVTGRRPDIAIVKLQATMLIRKYTTPIA